MNDHEKIIRWIVLENIATLAFTFLGCWLISPWFALLLFNITFYKKSK